MEAILDPTNMEASTKKKIVVCNGTFDVLHFGHLSLLRKARELGDYLIVALNSDRSIREIKGPGRPIIPEEERKEFLESLRFVDEVRIFDEATPLRIIKEIRPMVLCKGSDWSRETIIGADEVESWGGRVVVIPLEPGYSTTSLIERIRNCNVAPEKK